MLFLGFHGNEFEARELARRLRGIGVKVWCSATEEDDQSGRGFAINSLEAVSKATSICFLIGRDGVGGFMRIEVNEALQRLEREPELRIVPIALPDCARSIERATGRREPIWPVGLAGRGGSTIDDPAWLHAGDEQFRELARRLGQAETSVTNRPSPRPTPAWRRVKAILMSQPTPAWRRVRTVLMGVAILTTGGLLVLEWLKTPRTQAADKACVPEQGLEWSVSEGFEAEHGTTWSIPAPAALLVTSDARCGQQSLSISGVATARWSVDTPVAPDLIRYFVKKRYAGLRGATFTLYTGDSNGPHGVVLSLTLDEHNSLADSDGTVRESLQENPGQPAWHEIEIHSIDWVRRTAAIRLDGRSVAKEHRLPGSGIPGSIRIELSNESRTESWWDQITVGKRARP